MEVSVKPVLSRGEQPDPERRTMTEDQEIPPFTTLAAEKQLLARDIDRARSTQTLARYSSGRQ